MSLEPITSILENVPGLFKKSQAGEESKHVVPQIEDFYEWHSLTSEYTITAIANVKGRRLALTL